MKKIAIFLLVAVLLTSVAFAQVSVKMTRTNPGIAGKKAAQLIFDVVNTDTTHKILGFLWCSSPDDVIVSSSEGVGAGKAQYVSPKFVIDKGPSYKSLILVLESETPGDKQGGCTIKYIPFKEESIGEEEKTVEFSETITITNLGTDFEGHTFVLKSYTPETEATNETEAQPAKAEIEIDGESETVEVGSKIIKKELEITLKEANEDNATLLVEGTKTVIKPVETVRKYLLMNGEYVTEEELKDSDYREIRLEKTLPFVKDMKEPACPEGKTTCKASEVIDVGGMKIPTVWIVVAIAVIVLVIAYLLGRTSRH